MGLKQIYPNPIVIENRWVVQQPFEVPYSCCRYPDVLGKGPKNPSSQGGVDILFYGSCKRRGLAKLSQGTPGYLGSDTRAPAGGKEKSFLADSATRATTFSCTLTRSHTHTQTSCRADTPLSLTLNIKSLSFIWGSSAWASQIPQAEN